MTKFFLQLPLFNLTVWSSRASRPVSSSKTCFRVILGRLTLLRSSGSHNRTLPAGSLCLDTWPANETKSFSSNDLSEPRVRAVEKIVSDFVFPRDILYFPQHTCIRAIELFLQGSSFNA